MCWIEVTQDDILRGERNDPDRCPIARALYRTTGIHFEVEEDCIRLRPANVTWGLPCPARRFVVDFDAQRPVQPFGFQIELRAADRAAATASVY
jgi:hypothetical protein